MTTYPLYRLNFTLNFATVEFQNDQGLCHKRQHTPLGFSSADYSTFDESQLRAVIALTLPSVHLLILTHVVLSTNTAHGIVLIYYGLPQPLYNHHTYRGKERTYLHKTPIDEYFIQWLDCGTQAQVHLPILQWKLIK